MRVLGVDPGTRVTGYGIIENKEGSLCPVDFGVIKPSLKMLLSNRYQIVYESLMELIKKYSPDIMAVESLFFCKNVMSAMKLSQVRGVILLAGSQSNLDIYEYAPRRVKQAVVGRGSASKQQIQNMVMNILGLPELPKPADVGDALAVAICHIHSIGGLKQEGKKV